jgi:replicative DNA helicase
MLEHLPPHNTDAEEAVIAALMIDDEAIHRIRPLLDERDFFREKNGAVYRAICALAARREPTSPVLVASELAHQQQLEIVGGLSYLSQLTNELPTAVGAEWYARLIAAAAARRRLISASGRLAQMAYDESNALDVAEIISRAEELIRVCMPAALATGAESLADLTAELGSDWQDELDGVILPEGQSSGFRQVDYQMPGQGWVPGKLYGLVGPTSSLKSTIARAFARRTLLQPSRRHEGNARVLVISLEQTRREQWKTQLAALAGIDTLARQRQIADAARAGRQPPPLSPEDSARLASALATARENRDLLIKVQPGMTATEIKVCIQQQLLKGPLDLVIVDYLQRIGPEPHLLRADEHVQIATAARLLADTAFQLDVPILLCAQYLQENQSADLRKTGYRPDLEKVYGSKELSKVAYMMFGIYWRAYWVKKGFLEPDADPINDNLVELLVTKAQLGEFGTSAWLIPDPATGRLEDLACIGCGVLMTGRSQFQLQPDGLQTLCLACYQGETA